MIKRIQVVAKAILFDQEKVLVLKRSSQERKSKEAKVWDFPGGSLEPSEPVMKALAREVEEETGLTIKVIAPAYVYDEIQHEKHLIIIKFACIEPVGEVQLSDEHQSFHWVRLVDLEDTEFPQWMKDEIRRAYRIYMIYQD